VRDQIGFSVAVEAPRGVKIGLGPLVLIPVFGGTRTDRSGQSEVGGQPHAHVDFAPDVRGPVVRVRCAPEMTPARSNVTEKCRPRRRSSPAAATPAT